MNVLEKVRGRPGPPSADRRQQVGDEIVRQTVGLAEFGLRVDWGKLGTAEQTDLVALTRRAQEGVGFDIGRLSKGERGRWEKLVEKASGQEVFAAARERAHLRRELAKIRAEVTPKMDMRPAWEGGLLAELHRQMDGGYLWPEHVALIVLVLGCMRTGKTFATGATVSERDGEPVLAFKRNRGLYGRVGGRNDAWSMTRLEHVCKNEWFVLAVNAGNYELRLGKRARQAFAKGWGK